MPQYINNIPITFPGGSDIVGLTNGARATSNAIDNTTNQYDAVDIEIKFKLGSSGVLSTGSVRIGILGSSDGGITYENFLSNNRFIATITGRIFDDSSIIQIFKLTNIPQFWKLGIHNKTGATFDSTIANFSVFYAGVYNANNSSLATSQTSVTTSATLLAASNKNRQVVKVSNQGADTIYLGSSGVTIGTGFPLEAGDTIELPQLSGNDLFGIVPSVTSLASVMQW